MIYIFSYSLTPETTVVSASSCKLPAVSIVYRQAETDKIRFPEKGEAYDKAATN